MHFLINNLQSIQDRIHLAEQQNGRSPGSVSLLAVTKGQPLEKIATLIAAGQYHLGENYLQEALPKISALNGKDLVWHFLGPVQSKKTSAIAQNFSWIHTISRLLEAQKLSQFRSPEKAALNICIQVKLENAAHRSGVLISGVPNLVKSLQGLPRLRLRGLMTILPKSKSADEQHEYFKKMKDLFMHLNSQGAKLDTLSMGMSNDFESAIAQGATIVRIGSALFSPQ